MRSHPPSGCVSNTQWLMLILVVGFAARVALALALGINAPPPGSDSTEYDAAAWNLAQGRGYRATMNEISDEERVTAFRLPGTSLVWASVYAVFGHRYGAVRVLQCLAGAATSLIVFGIGRRCFGERIGWIAATTYMLWPHALLMSSYLQAEVLGTLWFLWFILAGLWFAERPSWGRACGSGVLLGCALLTRGPMFFMMPLIVLWVLWQFRGQTHKVVRALAIPLVALLLLVPWTVRNYLAFGRFIPISSQGGVTFLECNNRIVATNPMWYGYAVYARYHMPEFAELITRTHDESEISQVASHWAAQWLWDNPDKWCLLLYHKFCRAWTPFLQPHVAWPLRVGSVLTWGPILVLFPPAAFTTLWLFLRRGHPGWLLHLGILHYVLNVIPFLGFSRYRYPIEGLCIILACVSVVWLYERYALLCQTCANHKRAPLAGVRMRFAT